MDIKIIETGEIMELTIIDPKSGCDWTSDLTGNDEDIKFDEDGNRICDQKTFDWWEDLISRYQAADDRYYELITSLDDDAKEALEMAVNVVAGCDLENYPEFLSSVLDEFENN